MIFYSCVNIKRLRVNMLRSTFTVFTLILLVKDACSQETDSTIRRLRKDLLKNYDKNARPVLNHQNTTSVVLNLQMINIGDVDERQGTVTMNCWVSMAWKDEHLKWNPEQYDGMQHVRMADHEIWQPDISVYNAAESRIDPLQKQLSIVHNTGAVMWVPAAQIKVSCGFTYENYPNDVENCTILLGSWTTSGNLINLTAEESNSFEFNDVHAHWTLNTLNSSTVVKIYPCCPEPYITVLYQFTIRRRGTVVQQPIIIMRTISKILPLLMFWLPVDSICKLLPGFFAILCTVSSLILAAVVTTTPAAMVIMASTYKSEVAVTISALVLEIIIINVAAIRGYSVPPVLDFSHLQNQKLFKCFWVPFPYSTMNNRSLESANSDVVQDKNSFWYCVALLADRVIFIIFIIVITCF